MASGGEANNAISAMANAASARPVRVFVALKIAPDIAEDLAQIARPLERFAIRPVAKEDIHLTLVPPWKEPLISTAVEKLRLAIELHGPLALEFRHIGYGPDTRRPRFLWAECSASRELTDLHAALLRAFGQADERPFLPHVTLVRIRANAAMISRKCPINRDLALTQRIEAVELMQSPPPGGRGYKVIASLPLKNRPIS